jgi:hypothetical protein
MKTLIYDMACGVRVEKTAKTGFAVDATSWR